MRRALVSYAALAYCVSPGSWSIFCAHPIQAKVIEARLRHRRQTCVSNDVPRGCLGPTSTTISVAAFEASSNNTFFAKRVLSTSQ